MGNKHPKISLLAMLTAQAVILSLIEHSIPAPFAFAPGAKLGLSNLITILALFTLSHKDSFKIVSLRLAVATFLSGTFSSFLYGLSGTLLSFLAMVLVKRLGPTRVSIVGICIMGGMMHNIGQLSVFALLSQSWLVLNYLPILSLTGLLAGFFIGITGNYLLQKIKPLTKLHKQNLKKWL